ncbi:MAG: methylmalonyl-CoA mutase family protein [Ferroplasma sp.]
MENYWEMKIREIQKSFTEDKKYNEWKARVLEPWNKKTEYSGKDRVNSSGMKIKELYTEGDVPVGINELNGYPGEYPFTRGIYPNMYRGRNWTMRMFSGFGTPEDTNKRLKYLINNGETGLSIAFDMPTLYGYDSDNRRSQGEVGKCGVNVSSLYDMERIFDGIDLSAVTTSMTINAPAAILTAMYFVLAEKAGISLKKIGGTVQADILKEYIAQKEWMYPPEAHIRLIRDMLVYSTENVPKWNYISVSGYHIREAGSSAVQELAFTLADGFYYIEMGMKAGLNVDDFASRMSFFFNSSINFFEEIAKFRAARRIWATVLKEKYHAKNPKSMSLKFHTQTSGYTLTWQQPLNNIIRTTIEAMAAVLGGTQSLHTNSYDEAWALPTDDAVKVALRTQQIIAEESGIADVIDPLGGSYYLERLTAEMELEAYKYFAEIEKLGGILNAVKSGFIQKEIADTSYKKQLRIENNEDIIVGVNKYVDEGEKPINTLKISDVAEKEQIAHLEEVKNRRNQSLVSSSLSRLKEAMRDDSINLMPYIMDCVRNYCTLEEISNVGRDIFGEWKEPKIY